VDVALAQAHPVHGAEVTHGVGLMGVQNQLGFGRGAGGEVQQHGIGGVGDGLGLIGGGALIERGHAPPTWDFAAHTDAREARVHDLELAGLGGINHQVPHPTPFDAIQQIGLGEQKRRGHQHGPQLDAREHRFPER